jgi:hypothetical protein
MTEVYFRDSMESLKAYRMSDLAAGIPEACEVTEAPEKEVRKVLFQLRE